MGVSYKRLWKLLIDKDMKKRDLKEAANLSPSLMSSLNQDKSVTVNTLSRICRVLDCRIEDIMEFVPDGTEE
ncbi:MAG: putative transcriptional regulator [Clostridiales bacterium]|uniref:helix-turn-helix domain-containing protein n=1 Tax=Pygmaiobacter massiliensis TaxID=1917873 RepID=UPI0028A0DEFE|nr:helix-turn-helix transcriptional regulator [Pygmaiobacter massiliensis]MDK2812887.1 putative transcriptional regulator [Clostridiales bacterium]